MGTDLSMPVHKSIVFTLLAFCGLFLLSISIGQMKLGPGRDLPAIDLSGLKAGHERSSTQSARWDGFFLAAQLLIFFGTISGIVFFIFSPDFRKKVLDDLKRLALTFSLLILLVLSIPREGIHLGDMLERLRTGKGDPEKTEELAANKEVLQVPDFVKRPPLWIVLPGGFLFFTLLGLFVWAVLGAGRKGEKWRDDPTEETAAAFEQGLQKPDRENESENPVLQCWHEMSRIACDERGLERERHVTPREFSRRLVGAGFPAKPVEELTALFETVRYGGSEVTEEDIRKARECLTAAVGTPKGNDEGVS